MVVSTTSPPGWGRDQGVLGARCARASAKAPPRAGRRCWSRRRSQSCSRTTRGGFEAACPGRRGPADGARLRPRAGAPAGDPARLREVAAPRGGRRRSGTARGRSAGSPSTRRSSSFAKRGPAVVEGRIADDEDDAVAILTSWGRRSRKARGDGLRTRPSWAPSCSGSSGRRVRAADARLRNLEPAEVLVERLAPAGRRAVRVAARRDGVVPSLVGLGGIWTEALADAAVIPLPATPPRVEAALCGLRGAALLTGGRGEPAARPRRRGAPGRSRRRAAARRGPRAPRAQPGLRPRARRDGGRRGGGGRVRAAVVGAGLAGLAAACELQAAGADVVVLEARERMGGRVWSRTLANGAVVEMGAEYIRPAIARSASWSSTTASGSGTRACATATASRAAGSAPTPARSPPRCARSSAPCPPRPPGRARAPSSTASRSTRAPARR